jgi:dTDP-4-amino-4,6-dideoxygalactose transaminase
MMMDKLAVEGGAAVREKAFPGRGHVGLEEQAAVKGVFDAAIAAGGAPGYNGAEEEAYCDDFSEFMGGGYTDAVSSGTAGIYVALRALELAPFSEVIVGAVTDPGGMMPIPLLNLIPMVADTMPGSYNTGPDQVAALLSPRTRAIVVPHIAGEPADVAGLAALAKTRKIPLIEDCSQAHAARLNGRPVGTFGDIGVFSTMFGKHHSSGGQGGLVYTQQEELYQAIRRASDRGKPFFLPDGSTNVMASLNLNLNDLAAAIGRVQLRKLDDIVRRRRAVVADLRDRIADLRAVAIPAPMPGADPTYWFLRVRFDAGACRVDKLTFCRALHAEGLSVTPDYSAALPHTMTWFTERRVFGRSGYPWASPEYEGDPDQSFPCPNARAAINAHFHIPIHEAWGEQEVEDAAAILHKVAAAYRV